MGYNTLVFETAILERGYVAEEIKKESLNKVKFVLGAVIKGIYVKKVRWDSVGKCVSPKGKSLPQYDLPLEEVQSRLMEAES